MCFDNDDTADIYDQTDVKTRKPHCCAGCHKIIPAGSQMSYTRCLFDGHWSNWYECEDCRRMILSIAAEEIQHGCRWSEAWCQIDDLQPYLADRSEPMKLLQGTLEECWQQVNQAWTNRVDGALVIRR